MFLTAFISIVIFVVLALPIKNWLEIKGAENKDVAWSAWLKNKPSREEFCKMHNQDIKNPECDFCGGKRIIPSLEMVIVHKPKFGLINNSFEKYSYFKSHICSQCSSELFRERYEDQ
jgi:hypothetical protein